MDKVSEISSSKLSDAIINYRQWGEMYYNVQVYGVLPDGSDVTAALQALVNKATVESRTAIFFPPGDYKVTAISNDSAVWYVGDNARFVGGYSKTINLIGTNPGPYGGPPNPHASTHVTGGTDVIPNAVTGGASGLMSGADATFVRSTGETKTGAQSKADTALAAANTYTDQKFAAVPYPPDASTTVKGLTQLSTSTTSTATDRAATPSAVKIAKDRADDAYTLASQGSAAVPSFGKVNNINAGVANDTLTIAQGTGITVSTDPATKTVTVTATGSAAPGPHAATHAPGGSDPIQLASTTQAGLVQLNDTTTSTSTTQAGTANAVKTAKDRADAAFTSASSGKVLVRNAITGKGGTVADADGDGYPTFQELATGVGTIPSGKMSASGSGTVPAGTTTVEVTGLGFLPASVLFQWVSASITYRKVLQAGANPTILNGFYYASNSTLASNGGIGATQGRFAIAGIPSGSTYQWVAYE